MLKNQLTTDILGPANGALSSEGQDILLATAYYSLACVFPERPVPTIFMDGHGREPWRPDLDVSRTVGWFTTVFPIVIPEDVTANLESSLRCTKDSRVRMPGRGQPYFARRYARNDSRRPFVTGGRQN